MRWALLAVAAAGLAGGCSFAAPTADDGNDVTESAMITDTSRDDFQGGTLVEGVIAERGALEPAGYVGSSLHVLAFRGYAGDVQNQVSADTDIDMLKTQLASSLQAESIIPLAQEPGLHYPLGVELDQDCGECTFVYDGEVRLVAGDGPIELDADDHGLVEILIDGAPQRFYQDLGMANSTPLHVPADGWYPIRIVLRQTGGGQFLTIRRDGVAIPNDEYRVRADSFHGVLLTEFANFADEQGTALVETIDHEYSGEPEGHLDTTHQRDALTLRYSGQVFIAEPGVYTFAFGDCADDLYRVFIDGEYVAGKQLLLSTPTADRMLTAGWHSIVADDFDSGSTAKLTLLMGAVGTTPVAIAPEHLRPIALHGLSTQMRADADDLSVDHTTMTYALIPPTIAGTTIDYLDTNFYSTGDSALAVTVEGCSSPPLPVVQTAPPTGQYSELEQALVCNGQALDAGSALKVTAVDPAGHGAGTLHLLRGFYSYHGGPARRPLPDVVTYESRELDTSGAVHLDDLTADVVPAAAAEHVELQVRSAADAAELQAAPWLAIAEAQAGAVSQYRVVMRTEGWRYFSVERVTLSYTRMGR